MVYWHTYHICYDFHIASFLFCFLMGFVLFVFCFNSFKNKTHASCTGLLLRHQFLHALPFSCCRVGVAPVPPSLTLHLLVTLHVLAPLPSTSGHRRAVRSETEVQSHQRGAGPRSQRYDFHVNVHPACWHPCPRAHDKLTAARSVLPESVFYTFLLTLLA